MIQREVIRPGPPGGKEPVGGPPAGRFHPRHWPIRLKLGLVMIGFGLVPLLAGGLLLPALFNGDVPHLALIVIAGMTVAGALYADFYLTQPLILLARAAVALRRGEFDTRLNPTQNDEIGKIAVTVDLLS